MKITHVISSISKRSGGTSTYLCSLLSGLPSSLKNTLVSYDSNDNLEFSKDVNLKIIDISKRRINGFSREFYGTLNETSSDLIHINGLWEFSSFLASKIAQSKKIPYIISTHGMLEKWSLGQNKYIKKMALFLYQNKALRLASCIHATSHNELLSIREKGFKNPIALIPNAINLEEFPIYKKKSNKQKKLLFLSRIHKKKGIELIIKAWSELDSSLTKHWNVEIVGNGEQKYINDLHDKICELKLDQSITLTGPIFGKSKQLKYREADLFVLPSYSENFGIVIAEALASNVPVITTKGAPWEELNTNNCGDWIEIGLEPLKDSLAKMLVKSESEFLEMGQRGRKLIEKKYCLSSVARDMFILYRWLLKLDKTEPNFIYQNDKLY